MDISVLSIFHLLLLYSLPLVSAQCYKINGTIETDPGYQPCNTTTAFSMCCRTSLTTGVDDACLPSGLCFNACNPTEGCNGSGEFWRKACTDPTWQSPFCLKDVCTDPDDPGVGPADLASPVTQCPIDGKWCCGKDVNSTACCAADVARVEIAPTIGLSNRTISSSKDASSTATSASLAPTKSLVTPAKSVFLNTGGMIGLGIGVGIEGICIAAVAVIVFIIWRKQRQQELCSIKRFRNEGTQESASLRVLSRVELDTGY